MAKFFLQPIVSEADPYYALLTEVAEDILVDATKVVGSAQRRREEAVLQHGSVLLARSCQTPELPGLCDVADLSADPKEWSGRLVEWIAKAVGRPLQVEPVPVEIRTSAKRAEFFRYRDPAWSGNR